MYFRDWNISNDVQPQKKRLWIEKKKITTKIVKNQKVHMRMQNQKIRKSKNQLNKEKENYYEISYTIKGK